jgi:hypothetical protein
MGRYRALAARWLGRHAAMLVEEVVDGPVSGTFDFPIDIVLGPCLERDLVELVVVAGVAVADVGAGGELRFLFKTEQRSTTHATAADDGRVCRGGCGQALQSTVRMVAAARPPAQPVDAGGFHRSGHTNDDDTSKINRNHQAPEQARSSMAQVRSNSRLYGHGLLARA